MGYRRITLCVGCLLLAAPGVAHQGIGRAKPAQKTSSLRASLSRFAFKERLPQNFEGHSLDALFAIIGASGVNRPKSEFETQAAYEAEYERRRDKFLRSLPSLYFVANLATFAYDADEERMTATIETPRRSFDGEDANVVVLDTRLATFKNYPAQNAFGASVMVTQVRHIEAGISLDDPQGAIKGGGATYLYSIRMGVAEAKRRKPSLRVLLTGHALSPTVYQSVMDRTPTFDSPMDVRVSGKYISMRIEEVWIFDRSTGEVLKRLLLDDDRQLRADENRARDEAQAAAKRMENAAQVEHQEVERLRNQERRANELRAAELQKNATPPSVIRKENPTYPGLAQAAKIEGVVTMSVVVLADGSRGQTRVVSGHPLLVPAALRSLNGWRFSPGRTPDGMPLEMEITLAIPFRLESTATPNRP